MDLRTDLTKHPIDELTRRCYKENPEHIRLGKINDMFEYGIEPKYKFTKAQFDNLEDALIQETWNQ